MNPAGGTRSLFPLLVAAAVLFAAGSPRACADDENRTSSNLQLLQLIAGGLADSLASVGVPGDSLSVAVTVNPQDARWFLSASVERPFRDRGWTMTAAPLARYTAELSFYEMKVAYSNPRRSGIFGARIADRRVTVQAHVRLADPREGIARIDGERSVEMTDVVEISLVETLENPSIPQTHGAFPPEGFFAGWAEPLVLLGAVAVAVYLLFTVRS